ncbi:MAG: GNAT family N-acetyltransferase [Algoriphagus sp.]|uniref:GNAT family N-acetyltransferase n=1 Tax=Algoriphagus sp. TaxID=1872435 RepID=UPI00184E4C7A|nr:GNAT family N-acetyltransferase [Algoriphagus sp.]NVJ85776.1 GNAT family N-acetyltransferase [Algoriphagus sp.]
MKFRIAYKKDLEFIVSLLANDNLGKLREDFRIPLPACYQDAFDQIQNDKNQELVVMEDSKNQIIGTFQLSFIPYLTYQGGIRAQIEAVRIHKDHRGQELGSKMLEWAIDRAKAKGAHVLQLTTDKRRPEALRFYEKMGFEASHEGMKLHFKKLK